MYANTWFFLLKAILVHSQCFQAALGARETEKGRERGTERGTLEISSVATYNAQVKKHTHKGCDYLVAF